MALINWDDSFSVNVNQIDMQHKNLVKMINELNEAMKQGKGKDIMARIINDMMRYASTHFKLEEDYFDKFRYPDAENHKKEHAVFVEKVTNFKEGFDEGKIFLSISVLDYLSDWLQGHIKGTDKKYSQFFNMKGLK